MNRFGRRDDTGGERLSRSQYPPWIVYPKKNVTECLDVRDARAFITRFWKICPYF